VIRRRGRVALALTSVLTSLAASVPTAAFAGEQTAAYRASGAQSRLFDQYDNDGYSLAVAAGEGGSVELKVRVLDAPLESAAPFPTAAGVDRALPAAPERDAFARAKTRGSATQAEAVRKMLLAIASEIRYDADRDRNQDPAAVFASRRAYCVGYAELAVDLLRRVGISARTVQGVLRTDAGADRYDAEIGGVYHRWIEVWYPDRGYAFSDPAASINGVDARYVPFDRRSLTRPKSLTITEVQRPEGVLGYSRVSAGPTTLLIRASAIR
jgi:transglutaminase-like putative cysteine protease